MRLVAADGIVDLFSSCRRRRRPPRTGRSYCWGKGRGKTSNLALLWWPGCELGRSTGDRKIGSSAGLGDRWPTQMGQLWLGAIPKSQLTHGGDSSERSISFFRSRLQLKGRQVLVAAQELLPWRRTCPLLVSQPGACEFEDAQEQFCSFFELLLYGFVLKRKHRDRLESHSGNTIFVYIYSTCNGFKQIVDI